MSLTEWHIWTQKSTEYHSYLCLIESFSSKIDVETYYRGIQIFLNVGPTVFMFWCVNNSYKFQGLVQLAAATWLQWLQCNPLGQLQPGWGCYSKCLTTWKQLILFYNNIFFVTRNTSLAEGEVSLWNLTRWVATVEASPRSSQSVPQGKLCTLLSNSYSCVCCHLPATTPLTRVQSETCDKKVSLWRNCFCNDVRHLEWQPQPASAKNKHL